MVFNKFKGVVIFCVVSGNFFEMYDFMVYGFYVIVIVKIFFFGDNLFVFLMLFFVIFGVGFLMWLLGVVFLGVYIDCYGCCQGLIIIFGLMVMGILLIVFVFGYVMLGVVVLLLVLFGWFLQGFFVGVELGGVLVYLLEIVMLGCKGFFVSWQLVSQQVVVVFVGLFGVFFNQWLSLQDMGEWGWCVLFFIGCLIVLVLFVICCLLEEILEFEVCIY